jgi:hypothetical protein
MAITAAALISTLASQASSSTNRQSIAAPAAAQRPSLADTATISPASQAALAAATSGTSPPPAGGVTYDFTSMTNEQAATAASQLSGEGKLSAAAAGALWMTASNGGNDSIPIDPAKQATWTADSLSSTTHSNYVDTVKGMLADAVYAHNAQAVTTDNELLTAMSENQSPAVSASVTPAATGGIISTTA